MLAGSPAANPMIAMIVFPSKSPLELEVLEQLGIVLLITHDMIQ